jgi:Zn ribbon nucleic-acid-binding protein
MQYFNTDETAREYLESMLWPNGAVCPHCKNNEAKSIWKIKANKEKKIREGLYQCGKCDKQFTCTIGTILRIRISRSANGSSRSISIPLPKKEFHRCNCNASWAWAATAPRYSCNIASAIR